MNRTIAAVTMRGLLGRRRSLLLVPLPVVLILVALVAAGRGQSAAWDIVSVLGLSTILPLTALIVGSTVLGSEVEDGSIIHLLAKPVRRFDVVVSKWLVAAFVTALVCSAPLYAATVLIIGESHSMTSAVLAGSLAGSVLYSAVFVGLSSMTRRAVVVGLLYLLLWEGFVTSVLSGARVLSIRHYVMRYTDSMTTSPYVNADLSMPTAVAMSLLILGLALWQGTDRLRSYSVSNPS